MTAIREEKGGFKAIVLVLVGGNLTHEVPTPPLGDPGTDTTHERATPRGELLNQVVFMF